ncbi:MAG: DNA-3-methyladenine glycosylase [Acidimicrobiales bacterium]|nr:DNA-3-methyladenine glycosylase [Acidimicrobiales bacterium]
MDLARRATAVAPDLLGLTLVGTGGTSGRIVEVEAYEGIDDPASHGYRGPTPRSAIMFGPPGVLYVYRSYGMHWCANVVCGPEGESHAVLIRAIEPLAGRPEMRRRRRADEGDRSWPDRQLTNGPGKVCEALGIGEEHLGARLGARRGVRLTGPRVEPAGIERSPRIGIRVATERPWRWFDASSEFVSRVPRKR